MANVHKIVIEGDMPYDAHVYAALRNELAYMAGPVSGLKIQWRGFSRYIPVPETNGNYAYYKFSITGEESVWPSWCENFVIAVEQANGRVTRGEAWDLEWRDVPTLAWELSRPTP